MPKHRAGLGLPCGCFRLLQCLTGFCLPRPALRLSHLRVFQPVNHCLPMDPSLAQAYPGAFCLILSGRLIALVFVPAAPMSAEVGIVKVRLGGVCTFPLARR